MKEKKGAIVKKNKINRDACFDSQFGVTEENSLKVNRMIVPVFK